MTYHPVRPSARPGWRRRIRRRMRRVPWRGLVWLGGTAAVTGWWATMPEVGWAELPLAAGGYGLLLGAALASRREG